MSARIFGIGVGLFLLTFLWSLAIATCLITRRARSTLAISGPFAITFVASLTIVLLSLPRSPIDPDASREPEMMTISKAAVRVSKLPTDWMYLWRSLIVFLNAVALLVAVTLIYSNLISKKITRPKMSQILQQTRTLKVSEGESDKK